MYRTPEYQHLLSAERVMHGILEQGQGKVSELAACARALADIIQMKRNMRGDPNPRPVDVGKTSKRQRRTTEITPVSLPTPSPDAAQAPSNAPQPPSTLP